MQDAVKLTSHCVLLFVLWSQKGYGAVEGHLWEADRGAMGTPALGWADVTPHGVHGKNAALHPPHFYPNPGPRSSYGPMPPCGYRRLWAL